MIMIHESTLEYAINSAPTMFTPQHSQKAPIFPLTTGEWTILHTHASYRLKHGTKRSARQCTIRWYYRRPSNSTTATNATISCEVARKQLEEKKQVVTRLVVPWVVIMLSHHHLFHDVVLHNGPIYNRDDSINYCSLATKQYQQHNRHINRRIVWLQRRGGKAHGGGAWPLGTKRNLELTATLTKFLAMACLKGILGLISPPGYHQKAKMQCCPMMCHSNT